MILTDSSNKAVSSFFEMSLNATHQIVFVALMCIGGHSATCDREAVLVHGFRDNGSMSDATRIAMICEASNPAPEESQIAMQLRCQSITARDICEGKLGQFDVLIVPGGSGSQRAESLGEVGRDEIRRFVQNGGGYVGICGGAFLATSDYDWSLGILRLGTFTGVIEDDMGRLRSLAWRGTSDVVVAFTASGRSLWKGMCDEVSMQYSSGPIFRPSKNVNANIDGAIDVLARYSTEISEFTEQVGTMVGTPAIVSATYGRGRVIVFGPHPEMSAGCFELLRQAVLSASIKGNTN